jgi:hypothetical protein
MTQITVRGCGTRDHQAKPFKFTRILRERNDFSLRELEDWITDMLTLQGWQAEFTVGEISRRWIPEQSLTAA